MHPFLRTIVALLLLVSLPFASAHAQLIDAEMNPGDQFEGEIASTEDVDVVLFESIAGAGVIIKVGPGKKSQLVPSVQLVDMSDDSVVIEGTATKKAVTLKLANADKGTGLPTTGSYAIRVSGANDSTGTFKLKFTEQLAKGIKKSDTEDQVLNGDEICAPFEAVAGFETTILVSKGKKSTADPTEPVLTGPDGPVAVPEGKLKASKKGDKYTLKKVPLVDTGDYKLTAGNEGDDGALKVRVQLKRGKVKKRKLTELPIGETTANSLSGFIAASNDGMGLENVEIEIVEYLADEGLGLATLGDTLATTYTDANGNFIVQDLPLGTVEVFLDATGAVNLPKGARFGTLILMAEVTGPGSQIPQSIVMVDLDDPSSAKQEVMATNGQTTAPIAATSGTGLQLELNGGTGTTIRVGGVLVDGMVNLGVTPVPPQNVPMPLLDDLGNPLDAGSYVTVQPPNGEFDQNTAPLPDPGMLPEGLDIVFPNDRGFPPDTLLDVWSFDHDAGAWVNRSEQTGNQGKVSGDGLSIEADGVILKGGWHAPVLPVDPKCATTLTGKVVDADTMEPIPGVTVATDLGQFGTTDADGCFSLPSVPAYSLPNPPCAAMGFNVEFVTPVDYGAVRDDVDVMTGSVVTAGETDIGTIMITVPAKGSLTGLVTDNGSPVGGAEIAFTGAESFTATTDAEGRFFRTCVTPGSYIAEYTFDGEDEATVVSLGIDANQLTTINLQRAGGDGKKTLTVCVREDGESFNTPWVPISGATVTMVGSDAASSNGLFGTTNADGKVVFENVNPPYTVTAQRDIVGQEDGEVILVRQATSVIDVSPASNQVTVPMFDEFAEDEVEDQLADATISGTILDLDPASFFGNPDPGQNFVYFTMDIIDRDTASFIGGMGLGNQGDFNYEMFVPSGRDLSIVINRREDFFESVGDPGFGGGYTQTTGALWLLDVPALDPGEERDIDFDWDDALLFTELVDLELNNLPDEDLDPGFNGPFLDVSGSFDLYDPDRGVDELGIGTYFVFSKGALVLPEFMILPDFNDPKLDDFRKVVLWDYFESNDFFFDSGIGGLPEIEFLERGVTCDLPSTGTPNVVSVDFPQTMDISNPVQDEFFVDATAFEATPLTFDDRIAKVNTGLNDIILESDELYDDSLGVDAVLWDLIVEGTTDSVTLPPVALPMLADGLWAICIENQVYEGVKLNFDTLFGGDTEAIDQQLWLTHKGAYEGFLFIDFEIGQEPEQKGEGDS